MGNLKHLIGYIWLKKLRETNSFSAVAKMFRCHEDTVKRWMQRYEETGEVDRSPYKTRQSPVISDRLLKRALNLIDQATRNETYDIASWDHLLNLLVGEGFRCSRRALIRSLKKEGIISRTVPRSSALTKEHKRKRVELCQELATWTPAQLEAIVWTEEKKFTCGGSRKITYLCRRSDLPKEHAGKRENFKECSKARENCVGEKRWKLWILTFFYQKKDLQLPYLRYSGECIYLETT